MARYKLDIARCDGGVCEHKEDCYRAWLYAEDEKKRVNHIEMPTEFNYLTHISSEDCRTSIWENGSMIKKPFQEFIKL